MNKLSPSDERDFLVDIQEYGEGKVSEFDGLKPLSKHQVQQYLAYKTLADSAKKALQLTQLNQKQIHAIQD